MLSSRNTEARRQPVVAQEQADNGVPAEVRGRCPRRRFDGLATYRVALTAAQASTADRFHPSVSRQAVLAATAFAASPWS